MWKNPFGAQRQDTITAEELASRLEEPEPPYLLDVREPHEYATGHIPGAALVPLGHLTERLAELPREREIAVICRSGARSGVATDALNRAGFRARNLVSGMLGWQGPVERE